MNNSDPTSARMLVRIGLVLSLALVLIGSVRFARLDWTGLPLDRGPITAVRQVGPDCRELIQPYTATSGRVIKPVVVDEMQYMALVEYFRGEPREQLQVQCFYDPFTFRSGMSWVAHWLPFSENVALGLTNYVMLLAGLWIVLLSLKSQGSSARAVLAAGVLYTVSWNMFYFGTGVLIDSGVIAAIALCWYLLVRRRPWLLWPILLLGYPLKETIGIVVPVIWAWCLAEYREAEHRESAQRGVSVFGPAVAGTLAFVVGVVIWRRILPAADASWEVTPDLADIANNLTSVIGLGSFAVGVLPLCIPAYLVVRSSARTDGWLKALTDPAAVGVLMALGICGWSFITVDLTPRLFWIGFPFAASLAARWFSDGPAGEWLDSLKIPVPRSGARALT